MVAPKSLERTLKSATQLLEESPGKWFPLYLEALAHGDTDSSYLLLCNIVAELHPTARAQCIRMAARKGVILAC